MPNVPYPPGGLVNKDIFDFDTCVEFVADPLTITFLRPGLIFPTATGIFTPDIPAGIYDAGDKIGPFLPVNNNQDTEVYFGDLTNRRLYRNMIKIRSKCPQSSGSA